MPLHIQLQKTDRHGVWQAALMIVCCAHKSISTGLFVSDTARLPLNSRDDALAN